MIGENAYTPIMYRDLATSSTPILNTPVNVDFGSMLPGMMSPSYLNGAQVQPQPSSDQYINGQKKSDKKVLKTAGIVIASCIALAFIPKLRKGVVDLLKKLFKKVPNPSSTPSKNVFASVTDWFKNLFKKTPKP